MRTTVRQRPQTWTRMLKPKQSVWAGAWQLALMRSLPQLQGGLKLLHALGIREPFPQRR